MRSLRDQVAHAISHGNMTQQLGGYTAADLIAALGMSDPLGAALWRVTGNLDAAAFKQARRVLAERLQAKHSLPLTLLTRVSHKALEEWLACLCKKCGGRSFVLTDDGVKIACPECNGTGRGRFSDDERISALKIRRSEYSKLVAVFVDAHRALRTADSKVARQISIQLGRRVHTSLKEKGKPETRHGVVK